MSEETTKNLVATLGVSKVRKMLNKKHTDLRLLENRLAAKTKKIEEESSRLSHWETSKLEHETMKLKLDIRAITKDIYDIETELYGQWEPEARKKKRETGLERPSYMDKEAYRNRERFGGYEGKNKEDD